jgi:3-oxochol-4-en-24-oyl-CoA dehydrogenase
VKTDYALGLGTTEEHAALAESVSALAESALTPEAARAAIDHTDELPQAWASMAAQGVLGLHIADRYGGQDGSVLDLAVAVEVLGQTCAPGPLIPTVLASAIVAASTNEEQRRRLLPGLADGTVRAAVALNETLSGTEDVDGVLRADGTVSVLAGRQADVIVAAVDVNGDHRWVVTDCADASIEATTPLDITRALDLVTVTGLEISSANVLELPDDDIVQQLSAIILGAEAVGVASWCVSTAAQHAHTRVQFGRPVGQFQGVKHRCARAGIALEQARAAVWDAARALDDGDGSADYAAAIAALIAPDAAVQTARDCIQVLGGIGHTWEHDAHLYYRRALTLRGLLGRSRDAARRVAELALSGRSRSVSYALSDDTERYRAQVRAELETIAGLSGDEQLARLGDDGWVMPSLDTPLGRGAGPQEQVVIAEEIARAGITMPELIAGAWLIPPLALHGTDQQKDELLAPTLRSEIVWCQLFSEPNAGSDLASLRTKATKVDGGWRVSGQKIWTSLGFLAGWGALLARTDPKAPKHQGITYFVVDMHSAGVTVRPLKESTGVTLFSQVFFDDVFIPDSGVVGEVNGGWHVARDTLGNERIALGKEHGLSAGLDDFLDFIRHRGADTMPIDRVGQLVAARQTVALLLGRTLHRQLRGLDPGTTPNIAKYLNVHFGQEMADFCHAELGAAGCYEEADAQSRRWMEQTLSARAMTIYGGTTEIQLNVIGERLLGLPRDPEVGR